MEGISVIVCCYNSSNRLEETISYLNNQKLKKLKEFEVLIIDNDSNDDTYNTTKKLIDKYSDLTIKLYEEKKQGLSNARECGINNSIYEKIVFCDDDNLLFPDYLEKANDYFNNFPAYGAFGGQGYFKSNVEEIINKNQLIYAVGPQSNTSGDVTYFKGYIYGAGLCLRKQAYIKSKPNKVHLSDRKGNNLSSGGDMELCYNLILHGFRIGYFDDLNFFHDIPKERLNINYIRKFLIASAKEAYLLDGLQYKAQIHPKMFDKAYKRSWFIKLIRELLFIPKIDKVNNLKTVLRVKKSRIIQLLKLNFNYDRSFK